MKQPGEELQETLTELDDRAVVDYLIKNPEFFMVFILMASFTVFDEYSGYFKLSKNPCFAIPD